MGARSHERPRQALHGLVTVAGAAALASAVVSLVVAVAGGLLMACTAPAPPALAGWLVAGAVSHAALMICGFLGTVIGMERAVAAGYRLALVAPLASACGAGLLMFGHHEGGSAAFVLAAIAFLIVNLEIVARQIAPHTVLLLLGAVSWLVGCILFDRRAGAPIQWWLVFLVMTVAAERLEMTRMTRRSRHAPLQLGVVMALLVAGASLCGSASVVGAVGSGLFGSALILLSAWLFKHDIARRTLLSDGLSRYMAVCLLGGYGWLAVSGVGWIGLALGWPLRDMALHSLGLGFIVGMMMAHVPVILPALTGVRLRFGAQFYLPLMALHASLAVRVFPGAADPLVRGTGALLNAATLLLFASTVLGASIAWRLKRRREIGVQD